MNLQTMLNERHMTKYQLSKVSGVPKTTVIDICSGKSNIEACNARTVLNLSKALGCTMEDLMSIDNANYDYKSGLPKTNQRFEAGLPPYLMSSLSAMKTSWAKIDSGKKDINWDMNWSELNADINAAENEQSVSSDQAWYLREKYLRIERNEA